MPEFLYQPSDAAGEYAVHYGDHIPELRAALAPRLAAFESYAYIIDDNLPDQILADAVNLTGIEPHNVIRVDTKKKDAERLLQIWEQLVQTVPEAVIAVGGGSIGDLSGLACGTYQRGIPRFYLPTTVLAMVDASIGGKSGIDHGNVKNSVGVIHYPVAVINYVPFLDTLSDDEYRSGFAEVIKAAVLGSQELFDRLTQVATTSRLEYGQLIEVLLESSQIKAAICEEPNNRKIRLLYGHALGHAYEKTGEGKKRHGDCVAIGMNYEGAMSVVLGHWSREDWQRQQQLIAAYGLPTKFQDDVAVEELIRKMGKYKKLVDQDNLYFVLPDRIGHVVDQADSCRVAVKKADVPQLIETAIRLVSDQAQ